MDTTLADLRASVIEALQILRADADPLNVRAISADAVLIAALWRLEYIWGEAAPLAEEAPTVAAASVPAADEETDALDDAYPHPRSLVEYRQERQMRISEFVDSLGIGHFEYLEVVHRRPVDRRLRDQIAFKLGVAWQEIAEFMPEQPGSRLVPLPPREGALPPREPWYLFDDETGRIISGPHHEPLPENGHYLGDPITGASTSLVVLWDRLHLTEEGQLLPDGHGTKELADTYNDKDW